MYCLCFYIYHGTTIVVWIYYWLVWCMFDWLLQSFLNRYIVHWFPLDLIVDSDVLLMKVPITQKKNRTLLIFSPKRYIVVLSVLSWVWPKRALTIYVKNTSVKTVVKKERFYVINDWNLNIQINCIIMLFLKNEEIRTWHFYLLRGYCTSYWHLHVCWRSNMYCFYWSK